MLLNLTNHPSSSWDAAQVAAAEAQFGGLQDLPFPAIAPTASLAQIEQLADDYAEKVLASACQAVHLMGELTFTVALLKRLQSKNVLCVAATNHRKVVEGPNGQKTVSFRFIQFRPYPFIA